MKDAKIFIAGGRRPLWQVIIAAALFTIGFFIFVSFSYNGYQRGALFESFGHGLEVLIYFWGAAIGFTFTKGIQIDAQNSKFKNTFEIGPLKLGEWKKIPSPEYVSVFQQPLSDGGYIFEVNLWYDTNKHWQLYTNTDYRDTFLIGFDLSEQLGIDLLDATTPNDYKWIDKEQWREQLNETSSETP